MTDIATVKDDLLRLVNTLSNKYSEMLEEKCERDINDNKDVLMINNENKILKNNTVENENEIKKLKKKCHEYEQMINKWYMPNEYYQIDVKKYLLDKCQTQEERDRIEQEYILFEKKKFIRVLQFLIYFIDTLRAKNVVWGVGRGSSVASFCLFLIGVHKINPLLYNLDITEFLR